MILILCALTSLICILFLLSPFVLGAGDRLSPSSVVIDPSKIEEMKKTLLQHYLKSEELFAQNKISKREWLQRQSFLKNRYLDLVRRFDWIRAQKEPRHES